MDVEMDAGDPSDGTADGGSWRDNGGRLIAYRSASWRRIKAAASARPSDRYIPWSSRNGGPFNPISGQLLPVSAISRRF